MLHFTDHGASGSIDQPIISGVSADDEFAARLLEILAPEPSAIVVMIEAYFDESGTHGGSPAMCVAGYIYDRKNSVQIDKKWKAVLDKYNLPYFHMVDCAHGNRPFNRLTKEECINAAKDMIGIINEHASFGQYALVVKSIFDDKMHPHNPWKSAYTWCCYMALQGVGEWCDRVNYQGKVAYFFESGHRFQAQANNLLDAISRSEAFRQRFRYGSHTFADKKCLRPLQSADMLAWHAVNNVKRALRGEHTFRKDFAELIKKETYQFYGSADMFAKFQERLKESKRRELELKDIEHYRQNPLLLQSEFRTEDVWQGVTELVTVTGKRHKDSFVKIKGIDYHGIDQFFWLDMKNAMILLKGLNDIRRRQKIPVPFTEDEESGLEN